MLPAGQEHFQAASSLASGSGCLAAVRLPALSFHSPLHLMPVFRPAQAWGGVVVMVLGRR